MGISYPSTGNPAASVVNATAFAASTGAADILPANPSRLAGTLLINNMNVTLYVRCGGGLAAISGDPRTILVPPNGGTFDVPGSYRGSVSCITASVPTGTVQVIEPQI